MDRSELIFLGTRGSVAASGAEFCRFGGATSCVLLRMGGRCIVLDAGTGFMDLHKVLKEEERAFSLLLSHPHVDHICGLPVSPIMFERARDIEIYAVPRGGLGPREQIERLMSPPLWPVGPEVFGPHVRFLPLEESRHIGPVKLDVMEGSHPGGCSVFRLSFEGQSLVYATDYEIDDLEHDPLVSFARGCSLLLCDGQYSQEGVLVRKGFGHSSWEQAGDLAIACGAKQLGVFHHDPSATDDTLLQAQADLQKRLPNSFFAKRGERILLP